jgi:hypothetical protein
VLTSVGTNSVLRGRGLLLTYKDKGRNGQHEPRCRGLLTLPVNFTSTGDCIAPTGDLYGRPLSLLSEPVSLQWSGCVFAMLRRPVMSLTKLRSSSTPYTGWCGNQVVFIPGAY